MKKLIIIITLAFPIICHAQKELAVVPEVHGVLVFTDNIPVADYEVLGEISYSENRQDIYYGTPSKYLRTRLGLVINAILANRQVEGIITTINDDGNSSAKMIRFKKENAKADQRYDLAKVNEYNGYLYFSDCTPLNQYTEIKSFKGPSAFRYSIVRKGVLKKANKKCRHKGAEGVIVTYNNTERDRVQVIKY